MTDNKFALILTDESGNRKGVVGTPRQPRTGTGNNAATPVFLNFCRSVLAGHRAVTDILVVDLASWRPGCDVATLPLALSVRRAALDNGRPAMSYSVPERPDRWIIVAR